MATIRVQTAQTNFNRRMLSFRRSLIKLFILVFIHGVFTMPPSTITCQPSPERCQFNQTGIGLYADCAQRGLTMTPCDLPAEVASLCLDLNNMTKLNRGSFVGVPNLKVLTLIKNFIEHIDEDTFSVVPFLEQLVLTKNKLTSLPNDIFSKNHNMKRIILSLNHFKSLPIGALKSLNNASRVSLTNNLIENLNFNGTLSINITTFRLRRNKVSHLVASDFLPLSTSHINLLDIGHNKLVALNDSVFRHLKFVKSLLLNDNYFPLFNFNSIVGMTSLESLNVEVCKLKALSGFKDNRTEKIPELKELTLTNNQLGTILPKVFLGLNNLTHLNLTDTQITSLHNNSFYGLTALKYLNLNQNQLKEVNAKIFVQLPCLQTLQLSRNLFTVLSPLQFSGGIDQLKILDMSQNKITDFDSQALWDAPSLENLNLADNIISSLQPGLFRGLGNLKVLTLSLNSIKAWDKLALEGLGNLTNLNMKHLGGLKPPSLIFKAVPNLLRLDMSNTNLFRMEKIFLHLPSLDVLSIQNTNIDKEDLRKQPPVFASLKKLRNLYLSKNTLNALEPGTFHGLDDLRVLDLSKCYISTLYRGVFMNLTSLTTLNLAHNNIHVLSSEHLRPMPSLTNLLLVENQLPGVLPMNLFMNNQKLRQVNLAKNVINGFEENIFSMVRKLDISENPLICTCDLQWFKHFLDQGNIILSNPHKTNCSAKSISQFKGKHLMDFDPNYYCSPSITAYVFGSLMAVILIAGIVVVYRHRWWFNFAWFNIKLLIVGYDELQDGRDPLDYVYDIDVIFPDADEEWARGEFMAEFEENLPDFPRERVVCGEDDLPLGGTRLDAIDYVIENSFKIIVIVSNAAVNDAHFMTQLKMAVEHMNEVQLEKVVLVFREDVPDNQLPYLARLFLSRNKPYFEWTEERYGKRLFWEKLARNLRYNKVMNNIIPM